MPPTDPDKLEAVYNAIVEYVQLNGIPPRYHDLAEMVGFKTPAGVTRYVNMLHEDGRIDIVERGRASSLIRLAGDVCPCCGRKRKR